MNQEKTFIFDATTANFQEKVLEASKQTPVIVDFWASWCGPCRMLTPVLERAVTALSGKVLLAKVDTDREPVLAQNYSISSIPAVKAFRDGKVVDEFIGARDPAFVRAFLERLVPSEDTNRLEQAKMQIRKGLFTEAQSILTEIDPRSSQGELAERLRLVIDFLKQGEGYVAPLSQSADAGTSEIISPRTRYAKAAALAKKGDFQSALEELLTLVKTDRTYKEDAGRKAMLLLFDFLGTEHPLVAEYRRKLQLIL